MMKHLKNWPHLYCIMAGCCDTATGLLLMFAPEWTLRIMGIPVIPSEPVYMQWIGAFVFSVGFSYLVPFAARQREVRNARLRGMLEVTALVRFAVAAFILTAVLRGSLVSAWLSVFFTDLIFAVIQVVILKSGALLDD